MSQAHEECVLRTAKDVLAGARAKYQARVAQSRHPGHLLTRETFTEHLLRAGHCPRYQEYVGQLAERAAGTAPRRAEGRGCPVCGRSETGLGGNGAGQSQECASRAATSNAHSRFGASPFLPPRPQPSVPPAGEFPDPPHPAQTGPSLQDSGTDQRPRTLCF